MKVVFWPNHPGDGDGYYRINFPMREIRRQHHWKVLYPPFAPGPPDPGKRSPTLHWGVWKKVAPTQAELVQQVDDWLLAADFDVLVCQLREEQDRWPQLFRRLRAQGKRVLVDSDDLVFNLPSWHFAAQRNRVGQAEKFFGAMMAAADGVSVTTPALANVYRRFNENIRVIRNRLDWRMWEDITPVYEQDWRRIRVGWMGDTRWRSGDLRVLRGVIGPWLQRNPGVEFVAAGDPRTHDVLGVPPGQRVSVASTEFHQHDLADITATFDIGLVPLDLRGDARLFNDCKSHLKGLEYNACGIPFVASPSESYQWWVEQGAVGHLASTPRQWTDRLDWALATGVRRDFGENARAAAKRSGTLQNGGVDEWADWISGGSHSHVAAQAIAA